MPITLSSVGLKVMREGPTERVQQRAGSMANDVGTIKQKTERLSAPNPRVVPLLAESSIPSLRFTYMWSS